MVKLLNNLLREKMLLTHAKKMIPGLRSITYEEKLKRLKLPSLALRRLRGELIETFKILKGFDDVRKEK